MIRHVSCILLLEWSTTSQRLWVYRLSVPYTQKDPRFLFEKRRGQPQEFWSLVSTIDGSTLPQVGVEELLCGTPSTLVKHTNTKKKCTVLSLLQVQDTVGYETLGHCYFLEDGGEQRNVLDHNLGLNTRYGTVEPSDRNSDMCRNILTWVWPGYVPDPNNCK